MFEDVRHERSLNLILSLRNPDTLRQNKFTGDEIINIKNLALEKFYRQRSLKECVAIDLFEKQTSNY